MMASMLLYGTSVVILLVLIVSHTTEAVQCYVCEGDKTDDACAMLDNSVTEMAGCDGCKTIRTGKKDMYTFKRECVSGVCQSSRMALGKISVITSCCATDRCNDIKNGPSDSTGDGGSSKDKGLDNTKGDPGQTTAKADVTDPNVKTSGCDVLSGSAFFIIVNGFLHHHLML